MTLQEHPGIHGRDREVDAIREELANFDRGTGAVIVVQGASGMGKSRLLAEALALAADRGATIGAATAEPTEQVVELSSLLRALCSGPRPIIDDGALAHLRARPEERFWVLRDLQAVLERAALRAPLAIAIDDVHRADSGTAAALRVLPAELVGLPILWLLATRHPIDGGPVSRALGGLTRAGARALTTGPLDEEATARVAADLLRLEPDEATVALLAEARGSPFLIVEMLRGLLEEDRVVSRDGRGVLADAGLPRRVQATMRERLTYLSAPSREAVTVAASLGRTFSFSDLAETLGRSPSALLAPVGELLAADLLLERDDRLGFWHDITREAVRTAIPVTARRALDHQAANALLKRGALPVEVAGQIADSAAPGDEAAVSILINAARAVASSDPAMAIRFGRRALEIAPNDHHGRGELIGLIAVALHATGEAEAAVAFADHALRETLSSEQEAEVRMGIAGMFSVSPDARIASGRTALALPGLPTVLRARLLAGLVHNLFTAGRADEAREVLHQARPIVRDAGDRRARFILLESESGVEYASGNFERALESVTAASREGAGVQDEQRLVLVRMWHAEVLCVLDRYEEAFPIAIEGLADAQRDRQGWAYQMFDAFRARISAQNGYLSDAAAALEGRFRDEDGRHVVAALESAAVVALGRAALSLGDQRQVRRLREVALVMAGSQTAVVRAHAAWLLALYALADGRVDEAAALARAPMEAGDGLILPRVPIDAYDEVELARIALGAGDEELLARAEANTRDRAGRNPGVSTIQAAAAHVAGLAGSRPDDLQRAIGLLRDGPRPLALAAALADLGSLLAPTEQQAAIEQLSESLVLYTNHGALYEARRVRGQLRSLGVRRRLVPSRSAHEGWDALTDSEVAVAGLVADGFTNQETADRLYVSPHTVNSHLRHIFFKLKINSRVDLARLAQEQSR